MTIVIGLEGKKSAYLGGDSYCGDDENVDLCDTSKVFKVKNLGVGICGNLSAESVLRYSLKEYSEETITKRWLLEDFPEILREECIDRRVASYNKKTAYLPDDSSFIFALKGKIYVMSSDFGIFRSPRGYNSVGIATPQAAGAMEALLKTNLPPKKKIKYALGACCSLSQFVRRPLIIMEFKA